MYHLYSKSTLHYLAEAIQRINSRAKRDSTLYLLKEPVLQKLLADGLATIEGIQVRKNKKHSLLPPIYLLLIQIGDYYFHLPITSELQKNLSIITESSHCNPLYSINLEEAIERLVHYLGYNPLPQSYSRRSS
ncbi:YkyB family protein [Bacillus sp. AK128]